MAKIYTAKIVISSSDSIEDVDNPLMVKVEFDPKPEEGDISPSPPAFLIARDLFIHDVKRAIQRYVDAVGSEVEYNYEVPYLMQDGEEFLEEEGELTEEEYEEDDDSPAFGENLKPPTVN